MTRHSNHPLRALGLLTLVLLAVALVACPAARVNRAPQAQDQTLTTDEDTPIDLTLAITDPDGDNLTCTITEQPEHGTLTGTPPDLTYSPDPNYTGTDQFTYTTSDGDLTSDEATVTITITAANDAPVAYDQTVTTPEDTPLPITLTGTDPDGDDLTFQIVSQPSHGTLTGTPPAVTYTPDTNHAGLDTFTFTANDGVLTSAPATITIDVGATNDPPTGLTLSNTSVDENRPAGAQVGTFTTTDPDQDNEHTYSLIAGTGDDDNGDFAISDATLYTDASFDHETTPAKSVRVRTTDLLGATLDATFTITIEDVNEFPTRITLTPDAIPENQPAGTLVGTLTTTDPDDGDTHIYTLTSGDGDDDNRRFTISRNELRTTEPFDHETTPTLTMRVLSQDQDGLGIEQAIAITVTDVDDPAVVSVTIDQGDQQLDVGGHAVLTATVIATGGADASVAWSSDAPATASVDDDGAITANSVGTATVTATSVFDPTRSDSINVDVVGSSEIPVTGPHVSGMEHYDAVITDIMRRHEIPGGAVAVVKDGRLAFAHGYGWADVEHGIPVQPDTLFRVASLAKPITSAALLTLLEDGNVALDDPAFAYLPDLAPLDGAVSDPRLVDITIQDLLQHAGGWDRYASFDPMFRSTPIAAALGEPPPSSCEMVIRYMLGQPLQFDPGTRYAYSNFGYCVLGRIIERVTGTDYALWVEANVLEPAGADGIFEGRTRFEDREPEESLYYAVPGEAIDYRLVSSVFPDDGRVPEPYGGFYLEAMDASGGWVSSTIDFLRFVGAVDGRSDMPDILSPETIGVMTARPPEENATWRGTSSWYAMGWNVQPASGDATWSHVGSLPGTRTVVVRAYDGVSWAAFFNARSPGGPFGAELDAALGHARNEVTTWPEEDLFPRFP